jgi:hypothetical protein
MRRDSGPRLFVMLLSMTFLMLGIIADGYGGGTPGCPTCVCPRRVKEFVGAPFLGFLIAEQEADADRIRITFIASNVPVPLQGAVTHLRRDTSTPIALPEGIKLADLTDEDIRRLVVGDPKTSPIASLCFESVHSDQPGDPFFFLSEGAIRIKVVEGISVPREIGTTTVRWAQVFGFVIPEDNLE